MPKFNFKIDGKNVDITKMDAIFKHVYTPNLEWNTGDDKTTVVCRYLKAGERTEFTSFNSNLTARFDLKRIFEAQVDEVKNFWINDKELSKEDILGCVGFKEIDELINNVAAHIVAGAELTLDEKKN